MVDYKQGQDYQLKSIAACGVDFEVHCRTILSSASFICSVTVGISGVQYPIRLQRRSKDSSLLRSAAELKPYHAGAQCRIFATAVALKTSWSDEVGRPWCCSTRSAYFLTERNTNCRYGQWKWAGRWRHQESLYQSINHIVHPFNGVIRLGSWVVAPRALKTISFDFAQFNDKLFSLAQDWIKVKVGFFYSDATTSCAVQSQEVAVD